jgi:hypothetical protein
VNSVTNLPVAHLPSYLRQARLKEFTLINLAVALTRLLTGFAAPRCPEQVGKTHATRHPS